MPIVSDRRVYDKLEPGLAASPSVDQVQRPLPVTVALFVPLLAVVVMSSRPSRCTDEGQIGQAEPEQPCSSSASARGTEKPGSLLRSPAKKAIAPSHSSQAFANTFCVDLELHTSSTVECPALSAWRVGAGDSSPYPQTATSSPALANSAQSTE